MGIGEISGFALWAWPAGQVPIGFVVKYFIAVSSLWNFPEALPSAGYGLVYIVGLDLVVCQRVSMA